MCWKFWQKVELTSTLSSIYAKQQRTRKQFFLWYLSPFTLKSSGNDATSNFAFAPIETDPVRCSVPCHTIRKDNNLTVVDFTTYWKFQCWCIHCLFSVNECQWLVYTHTSPFIQTWYCLLIPNICITFEWLFVQFTNSKRRLVTMSVSLCTRTGVCCLTIQVLKRKSLLPKCFSSLLQTVI